MVDIKGGLNAKRWVKWNLTGLAARWESKESCDVATLGN